MRTSEERIMRMHARAKEIKAEHDRMVRRVLSGVSAMLLICLVLITTVLSGVGHGIVDSDAAGASMIADDVGGYVLVAVIAFLLGVVVTVTVKNYKNKDNRADYENRIEDKEEE